MALLQVSLNETQVVAPFAGIVAERLVTAGAVVQVTTPVATLMSRDTEISLSVKYRRSLASVREARQRSQSTPTPAGCLRAR